MNALARAHTFYTYARQDREKAQEALRKAEVEELRRAQELSERMLENAGLTTLSVLESVPTEHNSSQS